MFGDHCLEIWEHNDNTTSDDTTNVPQGRQSGGRSAVTIRNAITQYLNDTTQLQTIFTISLLS